MCHTCAFGVQDHCCSMWPRTLQFVGFGENWGEGGLKNVAPDLFLSVLAAAYITTAVHQRLTTCFYFLLFACLCWFFLYIVSIEFFFAAFLLTHRSCRFCMSLNWPLKDNDLLPVTMSKWKRFEHRRLIHCPGNLSINEQPLVVVGLTLSNNLSLC